LKTYELEIQQDEELEKHSRKERFVALVAGTEAVVKEKPQQQQDREESCSKAGHSKNWNDYQEESARSSKKKGAYIEEDSTDEEMEELDEHLAFLARRFSKLKFKRRSMSSRPGSQNKKAGPFSKMDKSKFKCFNCGVAGHFSNNCNKMKVEKYGK